MRGSFLRQQRCQSSTTTRQVNDVDGVVEKQKRAFNKNRSLSRFSTTHSPEMMRKGSPSRRNMSLATSKA